MPLCLACRRISVAQSPEPVQAYLSLSIARARTWVSARLAGSGSRGRQSIQCLAGIAVAFRWPFGAPGRVKTRFSTRDRLSCCGLLRPCRHVRGAIAAHSVQRVGHGKAAEGLQEVGLSRRLCEGVMSECAACQLRIHNVRRRDRVVL